MTNQESCGLLPANSKQCKLACSLLVAVIADGEVSQYNDQYSACCGGSEIMI
jgi:hypothetical protein